MKKIILTSFIAILSFITVVMADEPPKPNLKDHPELREQMNQMVLSMFDIDIMIHKTHETDYEILQEDAERILKALQEIRKKDPQGVFYSHLKKVEEPTSLLLKYSKKKDPTALKYTNQIFNACFQCHSVFRKNPLYKTQ